MGTRFLILLICFSLPTRVWSKETKDDGVSPEAIAMISFMGGVAAAGYLLKQRIIILNKRCEILTQQLSEKSTPNRRRADRKKPPGHNRLKDSWETWMQKVPNPNANTIEKMVVRNERGGTIEAEVVGENIYITSIRVSGTAEEMDGMLLQIHRKMIEWDLKEIVLVTRSEDAHGKRLLEHLRFVPDPDENNRFFYRPRSLLE